MNEDTKGSREEAHPSTIECSARKYLDMSMLFPSEVLIWQSECGDTLSHVFLAPSDISRTCFPACLWCAAASSLSFNLRALESAMAQWLVFVQYWTKIEICRGSLRRQRVHAECTNDVSLGGCTARYGTTAWQLFLTA